MAVAPTSYSRLTRYCLAPACVAAVVLLRWSLTPIVGTQFPYLFQVLAVLFCARYWGFGPSILGLAVALVSPVIRAADSGRGAGGYWVTLLVVTAFCVFICWLLDRQSRMRTEVANTSLVARQRLDQLAIEVAQRQREEKLSAQLRAIVESSDDAIVSKGLDGTILSWNRGAELLYGYQAEEAIGQPISLILPSDRQNEEEEILERIRQGGRVKHFESVRRNKNGKLLPVSLTVSPIRDSKGHVTGASHIARDVTERKQFEEQVLAAQKLESLGVLAGGLAHDFNNLLTAIMGNASLVLEDLGTDSPAHARLTEVLAASERAALLVRQMLAYAGKGRFVVRPLDLSLLITQIAPLIRTTVPASVRLELNLAPQLPPMQADAAQMQQLLMNLVINAVEAIGADTGSINISTWATTSEGEPEVVLRVKDTGCGMDEATNARIFDPFFTTKFPGRGLGLAAAHGIVRGHGGSISVESTRGEGSIFTAVFPAAIPEAVDVPPPALAGVFNGKGNVLVVDDEEMVRNMARVMLERAGYQVETAQDGSQGVDRFAARPSHFDAILLDLTMPVMNGQEALERIHAIRPEVPVILSSGFSEDEALRRFQGRGLAGFLQKPYTATALAHKLRQATGGSPVGNNS
jgi:PAS domain S-box-containing protein